MGDSLISTEWLFNQLGQSINVPLPLRVRVRRNISTAHRMPVGITGFCSIFWPISIDGPYFPMISHKIP
jgi:hypothetical protein